MTDFICMDSTPCFARGKTGICKTLSSKPRKPCPFRKPRCTETNGVEYPVLDYKVIAQREKNDG